MLSTLPIINIRKEPSERSELVTQVLFGELYEVLDSRSDWLLIRCTFDEYEGWLSLSQHSDIAVNEQQTISRLLVSCPFIEVRTENGVNNLLPFGSSIAPLYNAITAEKLDEWQQSGIIVMPESGGTESIMKYAVMLMGSPYMWGGRNPFGYDCSGFVQVVFKVAGIHLPRDAKDQAIVGEMIDFVDHAQAGDLAFFENESGQIVHVGILDGSGSIIHCSGYVRKDSIDVHGIFNRQRKKHTHKLRFIKRLV